MHENVVEFLQHGLNRRTRTIYYGSINHAYDDSTYEGGVDYASAAQLIKNVHMLDSTSTAPIKIIINNPGGNEYHMFAAYDAIRQCQSEVIGLCLGHAMSAGSVILQACDTRIMAPNAWLMIHYGTWGWEDHAINVEKATAHGKKLNKQMEDIYLRRINEKRPNYTRKNLQHRMQFDLYLDAEETVEFGLADGVDDNG
jgi:ATP-dependent Clp endopeptidase proteolytic subunit ClpP